MFDRVLLFIRTKPCHIDKPSVPMYHIITISGDEIAMFLFLFYPYNTFNGERL